MSRQRPAVINLDSDEEDASDEEGEKDTMDVVKTSQRHRHHRPILSESSSDDDESSGSSDDSSSDEDEDLTNLNSVSLRKKIKSEVKLFLFLLICIYYLLSFFFASSAHSGKTIGLRTLPPNKRSI